MKFFRNISYLGAMLALSACATAPSKSGANLTTGIADSTPAMEAHSLAEAYGVGTALIDFYARGESDARRWRRNINLGVLTATVYTTGAAGLRAHPDNIFISSLIGSSLPSLDAVTNPGGPEAWSRALGSTLCYTQAAASALAPEIQASVSQLEAQEELGGLTADEAKALGAYRGSYMSITTGYQKIYVRFLQDRTTKAMTMGDFQTISAVKHERDKQVTAAANAAGAAKAAAAAANPAAARAHDLTVVTTATSMLEQQVKACAQA
ncbi:hypothetical protein [Phenylobacterium sp.]|uniref:hypothetical protein n=1 Tax=Phenylobacterium sp. TaxID=1871053 RepID=UPI002FC9B621